MTSANDLVELSRQLKQERLFVSSEREQLQSLNEDLQTSAQRLYHLAWITRQQRQNLDQLLRADKNATPEICCERANDLDVVNFVDGYRHLTYHESKIGECLKLLRESPKVVSACFCSAETLGLASFGRVAQIVMTGLYGNAVMPQDENYVLLVLKSLVEMQVVPSDNPRRLLRKGKCSFCVFFKLLNEGLFSSKLFLTAAFHTPIMQLLMEDEWFYDIDPERALYRFPNDDRKKRFGEPGTDEYLAKTKEYREMTNGKLYMLAERFISSLQANMYCFPQSLAWLLAHLYKALTKSGKCDQAEARAICADLIFVSFICPAICDPEPYGITTDAPISYIARHNLMQVATILQMLAISSSLEAIEPKQRDLYAKFPMGCMNFLLDSIVDQPVTEQPACVTAYQLQNFHRAAVFMTMSELMELLSLLREVFAGNEDAAVKKQLSELLSSVPSASVLSSLHAPRHLTPTTTPQPTPPGTPPSSARKLRAAGKDIKRLLLTPGGGTDSGASGDEEGDEHGGPGGHSAAPAPLEDVLVISLGVVNDCPGMLHEQKVLEQEVKKKKGQSSNSLIPGEDDPISESEINLNQKRTRFSLSHDQDSIATSDNLEAISEAASSHSVGSDLENEEDDNDDNLSDFVSANVSGRGTPSISGRDTPLSQVESVISGPPDAPPEEPAPEDNGQGGAGAGPAQREEEEPQPRPFVANLPVIVQKRNREDVTDRFGKFEIKQELEKYETKSSVSDTWSTDVLASDSEPPDQNQLERLEEVAEETARRDLLGVQLPEGSGFGMADMSETASDAWSTDVLASDTSEKQVERLLELEQDEMSSVSSRGCAGSGGLYDDGSSVGSRSHGGQYDQDDVSSVGSRRSQVDEALDELECGGGAMGGGIGIGGAMGGVGGAIGAIGGAMGAGGAGGAMGGGGRMPFAKEVDRTRASSNIPIKSDRFSDPVLSRHSAPRPRPAPASRPTSEVLDTFDPLLAPARGEGGLASSAVTLVGADGTVTSPDQGIASSTESVKTASVTSLQDDTPAPSSSRPDSGVEELSELAEGLKLTECQNLRLDAHRFSDASEFPGLFDPLLQDSGGLSPDLEPIQRLRTTSEPQKPSSSTSTNSATNPSSNVSVNQGARPKVPPPNPSSAPRISVNDLDATPTRAPPNRKGVEDGGGDQGKQGGDGGYMRNGGVELSHPEASTPVKAEVMNSREEEEKEKKKAASGGSGFIRSFKERFSKGPFTSMPTLSMRGGKRKLPQKPTDKEEAKLIDLEKSSGEPILAGSVMKHGHSSSEDLVAKAKSAPKPASNDDSVFNESSDDILAKYRRPTSSPTKPLESGSGQEASANQSKDKEVRVQLEEMAEGAPAYDPNNLENCKAFIDAKKKLRLVLCMGDLQAAPWWSGGCGAAQGKDNELVLFLKAQLAESINLQDKDTIAQLHETIRCLRLFDSSEVKKLLRAMKEEHRARAPYISYLVRCRQGLLSTLAHLDRLHNRVHRDKAVVNKYFLSVFVRLFMEKRERQLNRFIGEFQRLTMPDEKADLVEQFLRYMHNQIDQDPVWKAANERQIEEARLYIERNVMSHIYTHAMFPNGDGDILRDKILNEHMKKLGASITPSHKDLSIPPVYHYECPWPAAQAEIFMINAYKTPKDKLACVWKCSQTIMNLLRMARDKSVPAADDFMPVLIYVLLKANPPNLLSTVQYVNSFYGSRMQGEEQYWWVQFSSAIEFIKTMD